MNYLHAEYVADETDEHAMQALVALIEPNGDKTVVRCHMTNEPLDREEQPKPVLVEFGDKNQLPHLIERYGQQVVFSLALWTAIFRE